MYLPLIVSNWIIFPLKFEFFEKWNLGILKIMIVQLEREANSVLSNIEPSYSVKY